MDKGSIPDFPSEAAGHIEARERRVIEARKFNLLSNVFMRVALRDKKACQYVLRILTRIPDLVVKSIRTEYRVSKLTSHDVVLDVLAEDGNGKIYNIEIQRADTVDHARRVRLHGAMIDSEYLEKGKTYADLPDLFIIYISETDLWKAGFTTYRVKKCFENTDIPYNDGQHILYVNAAVNDGTEAADLMQYFKTADPNDMSHGDLSKRVHLLKCEEGGYQEMCEVSERIFKEGHAEGRIEGRAEGRVEGRAEGRAEGRVEGRAEGRVEGRVEGRMEHAQSTAFHLADMGLATEKIASAVEVNVSTVKQWLDNRASTIQ